MAIDRLLACDRTEARMVRNRASTRVEPDDDGGRAVVPTLPARGERAQVWYAERDRLVGMAYRVLGSVFEAEEVVQEAFLRLYRSPEVEDPGAWLTRVASRLCLDRLGAARAQREVYVGQWLPEPMFTQPEPQDKVALAESVSAALLVVLETLSPLERVVFVLREAFGFDHAAIAALLGRRPAAIRQVASRAHRHMQARRPRFEVDPSQRERAARAFLAASAGADLEGLLTVLDPEVVLRSDGGGKVPAAPHPISGAVRVARAIVRLVRLVPPSVVARGVRQRHHCSRWGVPGPPILVSLRGRGSARCLAPSWPRARLRRCSRSTR
jgi:RNA polymerase sigma-70 factor (ECF subfamily)